MVHPKVAVVGAGIVGVSSALAIQKMSPHSEVVVFAAESSPYTTGDGAAGLWCPVYTSDTPEADIVRWGKVTYNYLAKIAKTSESAEAGAYFQKFYDVSKNPAIETPYYSSIPIDFRPMTAKELTMFPDMQSGFCFLTVMSQGSHIINYIQKKVIQNGGKFVKKRIMHFDELSSAGFNIIINCSGLGARQLCSDLEVYPIRGQIHKVQAPWIKFGVLTDHCYIIPVMDQVVLGGTHQKDNWSTDVCQTDENRILQDCSDIIPSLKQAKRVTDWVGLRPGRTSLRLEREILINKNTGQQYTVVHNYGHGGAGLTLFWGTANEAADLIKFDLDRHKSAALL